MKKILLGIFLFIFSFVDNVLCLNFAEEKKCSELYKEFFKAPRSDSLKKIELLVSRLNDSYSKLECIVAMYEEDGFKSIEDLIKSKNSKAIDFLVAVKPNSDGEIALVINWDLGLAIDYMAPILLSKINEYGFSGLFLDRVLCSLDTNVYVDDYAKSIKEFKRRKNILSRVNDPKLNSVKKRCISILRDCIKKYEEFINSR